MAVYFIESARRIKIGYTADFSRRLKALKTGAAHTLKVLGVVEGDRTLEKCLHRQLADHRTGGEWFKKNAAVVCLIEETIRTLPAASNQARKPISKTAAPTLPGAPYEEGDDFVSQIDRLIAEFAPAFKELKQFCAERLPALKALPLDKKERAQDAIDAAKDKYFAEFWPCASREGYRRDLAEEAIAKKCEKAKAVIIEVLAA